MVLRQNFLVNELIARDVDISGFDLAYSSPVINWRYVGIVGCLKKICHEKLMNPFVFDIYQSL